MKIHLRRIAILLILLPNMAFGGLDTMLKNVFPKGTMSNTTRGQIVRDQTSGHYSGGSMVMKAPADPRVQLLHVTPPSCALDGLPCGAQFELIGGGLSMLSSSALLKYLNKLPTAAPAYAGMLMIKEVSPQIQDLIAWMDNKADWLNEMSNLECKDMQNALDGLVNMASAKAKAGRQIALLDTGMGRDASDIQDKSRKGTDDGKYNSERLKTQLGNDWNLVWMALEKKGLGSQDQDGSFRELLMSISGTIIGRLEGESRSVKHLKSLISKDLIEDLIGLNREEEQEVELFKCNEKSQCLKPSKEKHKLQKKSLIYGQMKELLTSITEKVKANSGSFTKDEETLISISSVPLITRIQLDLETYANPGNSLTRQEEFIQALCFDVIISYLQELLYTVQEAVGELSHDQLGDREVFSAFERETSDIMRSLSQKRSDAFKRYDLLMNVRLNMGRELKNSDREFELYMQSVQD